MNANQGNLLLASTVASFLPAFMSSSLNLALPLIAEEYGMGAVTLGWTVTAYLLTMAIVLLPAGRIADWWGKGRLFQGGILCFILGTLCSGVAFSGASFIMFRVVQALGGALIFATSVALLTDAFPAERRGRVLGVNTAAIYLGLSLGPSMGGFLVQTMGWRSVFFFTCLLGAVAFLFSVRSMGLPFLSWRSSPVPPSSLASKGFDVAGAWLYAGTVTSFILGVSRLHQALGIGLCCLSCVVAFFLFRVEAQRETPIFPVQLFASNRTFAWSNLSALVSYASTHAVAYLLSLYLQYVKGLSPAVAGWTLILQPSVQTLSAPISGRASDRWSPRLLASLGLGIHVAGLLLCASLDASSSLPWVLGTLAVLGLGFGLFSSPNANAIMSSVEKRHYSTASATLAAMRLLGQMSSMGITLLVFSVRVGDRSLTPEVLPLFLRATRTVFFIFASLNVGAVVASVARGKEALKKKGVGVEV